MKAALWCFAWDFADGVDAFLEWAAKIGIDQLNVAATYHAGWFLHPRATHGRAYMPEDGVCYFHPQTELYAGTRLKPKVAQLCREIDWFAEGAGKAAQYGLKVASWTIGCHNTPLGLQHPECTSHNCFGDSYPHALCPALPEVQAYLRALCRDLTYNHPIQAIQPESFGYSRWRHGHHHERDLTGLSELEARLMDLCFHPATCEQARFAGIDTERLRLDVCGILDEAIQYAPDRPAGHPATWDEVCERIPELNAYQAICQGIEVGLIQGVAEEMHPDAEIHLLGTYREGLPEKVTALSCSVYGQSSEQVRESVKRARLGTPTSHQLHVGVRLGVGVPASQSQLQEILVAVQEGGADRVIFYNSSESPPRMLSWIEPSLRAASLQSGRVPLL